MSDEMKAKMRRELETLFGYDMLAKEEKRQREFGNPMPFCEEYKQREWEQFLLHYYHSIAEYESWQTTFDRTYNLVEHLATDCGVPIEDAIQYIKEETLFIRIRDNVK